MKKIWSLIFLCCLMPTVLHAQRKHPPMVKASKDLGPAAGKLAYAYEHLQKNKLSSFSQLYYVKLFPDTKDKFMAIFDPDDRKELYKLSHDYIEAFKEVGTPFPDSVLRVGFGICKEIIWSSGPSEELQHALLEISSKNISAFVSEIYLLKKKDIDKVMRYLADVEQQPVCSLYKDLIAGLHKARYYELSGRLERFKGTSH